MPISPTSVQVDPFQSSVKALFGEPANIKNELGAPLVDAAPCCLAVFKTAMSDQEDPLKDSQTPKFGTPPTAKDETEQWNGSAWTETGDLSTGRDLYGQGGGTTSTAALAVGGVPNLGV